MSIAQTTQLVKKPTSTAELVKHNLDKNRDAIIRSLPKGFNFDRMCRAVINAISTTPSLAKCTASSLFLATVKGFSLGLEPNGPMQEGYLVPFKNNKKDVHEAQFMPGYRGLIALARRSGEIAVIYAREVYKNDYIEVVEGLERKLIHKPLLWGDRGELLGFYGVFTLKTGEPDFEVMTIKDIEDIRARSKAATEGPWVTDYNEMGRKTVIKKLLKRAPMSIELAGAIEQENKALEGQGNDIIDVEGLDITEEPKKKSSLEDPKRDDEIPRIQPPAVSQDIYDDEKPVDAKFQKEFVAGGK